MTYDAVHQKPAANAGWKAAQEDADKFGDMKRSVDSMASSLEQLRAENLEFFNTFMEGIQVNREDIMDIKVRTTEAGPIHTTAISELPGVES